MKTDYQWKYCSVGGVVRVNVESGEDIAHLDELDQKLWTALSCPVAGLAIDPCTMKMLDTDGDGKIRVPEVVAAAKWITGLIKDKDLILKGEDRLPLDQFNTDTPDGQRLLDSAKRVLANLGRESDSIGIDDMMDERAIFARTAANGDGIVSPFSTEDKALAALLETVMATEGSVQDRSGEAGVTAGHVEAFYNDLADFAAWKAAADADKDKVFPYGESTPAALSAMEAVKAKVDDFFVRCKLIAFDPDAAGAVDVAVDKIAALSGENLAACTDRLALQPIARPTAEGVLSAEVVNPAWKAAYDAFVSFVPEAAKLTDSAWKAVQDRFDAYKAWTGSKKGSAVEALGLEKVQALLKEDAKQALLDLIEADKAVEPEIASMKEVGKLLHYYRDFATLLRNFVIFSDFYNRRSGSLGVFEAGRLYIDQRCCNLCIKVTDMAAHADMAALSGMFLLYCHCVNKATAAAMDIVAVMTDGGTAHLRPGKNAVFYDRSGADWDAVVTKVVDNPISIKAAFWSPYRKFANFVSERISKSAADKEAAVMDKMKEASNTDTANLTPDKAPAPKVPFDIAKFAGIFAAIGMGLGYIGAFLTKIVDTAGAKPLYFLGIVAAVILCISGPSCFIAWTKLRKRDLGPVLNANGWAINSVVLVNVLFGKTLTTIASYPIVKMSDPFKKKQSHWRWWALLIVLIVAGVAYWFLK